MRSRRYQVNGHILIRAPREKVYAIATEPTLVPRYVDDIARIEVLGNPARGKADVISHLRFGPIVVKCRYVYRYAPPAYYGGIQARGWLMRGYFSFHFRRCDGGTEVSHSEGIISRIPGLSAIAGFIYFRMMSNSGLQQELEKLKKLIEDEDLITQSRSPTH